MLYTGSKIKAILACDEKGGIGKDGALPWPHNAADMRWFRNNTGGHVVVMGSKTWSDDFMPCPMPKRVNVLATSAPDKYPGAHRYICGDLAHQLCLVADDYPGLITWVIGGSDIISQTIDVIDEFYISRITGDYNCDTFLPIDDIEHNFTCMYADGVSNVTFEIWKKKL